MLLFSEEINSNILPICYKLYTLNRNLGYNPMLGKTDIHILTSYSIACILDSFQEIRAVVMVTASYDRF